MIHQTLSTFAFTFSESGKQITTLVSLTEVKWVHLFGFHIYADTEHESTTDIWYM